jgi:hypothetical protein
MRRGPGQTACASHGSLLNQRGLATGKDKDPM